MKELLSSKFNISAGDYTIERAHRVGRARLSKPRLIVAKFQSYKTRESILSKRKCLSGTDIFVREDYSDKVLAKRRELLPQMHEARRNGMIAFLRYDKLVSFPNNRSPIPDINQNSNEAFISSQDSGET